MFSKGELNITLQKTAYVPGDTISDNATLTLNKPIKARGMSIYLIGEQETKIRRMIKEGGSKTTRDNIQNIRIYDFKQDLDSEKEYSQRQEYPFEIKIPSDMLSTKQQIPEVGSTLDQDSRITQTTLLTTDVIPLRAPKWYLLAKFDIPGGIDINKKVDIIIG